MCSSKNWPPWMQQYFTRYILTCSVDLLLFLALSWKRTPQCACGDPLQISMAWSIWNLGVASSNLTCTRQKVSCCMSVTDTTGKPEPQVGSMSHNREVSVITMKYESHWEEWVTTGKNESHVGSMGHNWEIVITGKYKSQLGSMSHSFEVWVTAWVSDA